MDTKCAVEGTGAQHGVMGRKYAVSINIPLHGVVHGGFFFFLSVS